MVFLTPTERRKCGHRHAKVDPRCKWCGKVTRSHQVPEEFVTYTMECPDCGQTVSVVLPAYECHACYEAHKSPEEE